MSCPGDRPALSERREGGLRTRGAVKRSLPGEPLVTVVTVVKNGAARLRQTIDSVLGQAWSNLEYVIVDGGSTDETLDILGRYDARLDYWVSESDRGIYDAMNKGIALANGDLIGLLNADDWYEPGAVEAAARALVREGTDGIYYGDRYIVQDDFNHEFELRASFDYWRGMTVGHQAMFVHREVYSRLGTYSLAYRLASDFEFLVRALRAGEAFVPINCFVVHFRDSGASSKNTTLGLMEIRTILGKSFGVASPQHIKNLLVTSWRLFVFWLKWIIRLVLGEKILLRLRAIYGRAFVTRGKRARGL